MHKSLTRLLATLPSFMVPFVARSLRGTRGPRYLAASGVFALMTVILGLWIGLGDGYAAHDVRAGLWLEQHRSQQQLDQFVVFAGNEKERARLEDDAERIRLANPLSTLEKQDWGWPVGQVVDSGRVLLVNAAAAGLPAQAEHAELYRQVCERIGKPIATAAHPSLTFDWTEHGPHVERVLALDGVPEIRIYESPLGVIDSLRVVGWLAGLLLLGCLTALVPLLVGLQQAQEQHENTLAPLTGTGLTARQLALGLAAGPASAIGLIAAPQLLLFGVCAVVTGNLGIAAALSFALAGAAVFVTFAAQWIGHLLGTRQSPGIAAAALVAMIGVAWLSGVGSASNLDVDLVRFPALLPTMGLALALTSTFSVMPLTAEIEIAIFATVIGAVGAWICAGLLLSVMAHKLEGRPTLLSGWAALLGALTCIALVQVGIPEAAEPDERLYVGLGILLLPFTCLLLARVSIGDQPPAMTGVPIPKLVLELGAWIGLTILAAGAVGGFDPYALKPFSLFWIGWSVVVLGLIVVHHRALPSTLRSRLFLAVCGLGLAMGITNASACGLLGRRNRMTWVLDAMVEAPVLVVFELVLTLAVPVLLLRNLRNKLGSISRTLA